MGARILLTRLDRGVTKIKFSKSWDGLYAAAKLDFLQDAIFDLTEMYNKTLDAHNARMIADKPENQTERGR